jgi:hypothetical protein
MRRGDSVEGRNEKDRVTPVALLKYARLESRGPIPQHSLMPSQPSPLFAKLAGIFIGGVWIFHGLYSKIFDGIPRHKMIVGRILGEPLADLATPCIGMMEVLLGCWAIWGRHRKINASIQTLGLISMNTLEIILARDLLISAAGMVALNLCFIALIWWWATRSSQPFQLNRCT